MPRGYVICSYERSGSNYLCAVLGSTDVLGRPADYFNGPGFRAREPDYPLDREAQLRNVLTRGCTGNGVYGLKMFCPRFDEVGRVMHWIDRLPSLRYVHLVRNDLLGQSISVVRAAQSGRYRSTATASKPERYDRRAIMRAIETLSLERARWSTFFARNGIVPLQLEYERVAQDPQAACDAVAQWIGLDAPAPLRMERVELAVQRDATSEQWRQRFLAESADTQRLDDVPASLLRECAKRVRRIARRLVR